MTASEENEHPLDGLDPDACYRTMMTERTTLITARRESEDNLIKTIIQISTTLIALTAGFSAQAGVNFSGVSLYIFLGALLLLTSAIIAGLFEHWLSSKAYSQQQKLLEDYYTKTTSSFAEPPANKWVRVSQVASLTTFTSAIFLVSLFAGLQFWEKSDVRKSTSTSTSAAPTSTSTSTAPTSTPTAAAKPGR